MILSCPFRCFIKTQYGICIVGKCMNSKFKAIWNGDEIDKKLLLKSEIDEKDITSKGLCEYIKEMGGKNGG